MYKNFFEFKLNTSIGGKYNELVLYAPKNIHRPLLAKIDYAIRTGLLEFSKLSNNQEVNNSQPTAENENSNIFENMDATQIVNLIKMLPSKEDDFLSKFYQNFKQLMLSSEICKIKDNNQQLQEGYYDQMSAEDGDRLMGEYVKNFFTISTSL